MRLLLDTHVVIAVSRGTQAVVYPHIAPLFTDDVNRLVASVASLWEIAIKTRLGKLEADVAPGDMAALLRSLSIDVLPISDRHATVDLATMPPTRDPFDRMLLAQCQVEGLQLVTVDRALVDHPLAWRPA